MRQFSSDNWIICLHRAGLDNTRHAVASFLTQDIPVKVLILDRESTDGFGQWARAKYPEGNVTILWDRHDSVAAAWNRALSLVLGKFKCSHALVCNNDVELRQDTYRLLLSDGRGFVTAVGVKDKRQMQTADPTSWRPNPDFSCFFIRDWVWRKVRPFDESYLGAFAEDGDMHAKLHSLGIEAVSLAIPYYHIGSGTLGQVPDKEAETICLQADKNREYFFRKWGFRIGSPEYDQYFRSPATLPDRGQEASNPV